MKTRQEMVQDRETFLDLSLIHIFYFVLFRVLPIINMRLAFFTYSRKTAWEWAGLKYFRQIFSTPQFFTILENTLIISFVKYVLLFPFCVIFAILLLSLIHIAAPVEMPDVTISKP